MRVTRARVGVLLLAVVVGVLGAQPVLAQDPAAGATLTAPITGIKVESATAKPQGYNLDITIANPGTGVVSAEARVSGPKEWKPGLLHRVKEVFVKKVELAPGEENSDLRFHFDIPQGTENGTYTFTVGLFDEAGRMLSSIDYRVVIDIPPAPPTAPKPGLPQDVRLDPQYTHLTGPVGTTFTFRVNLKNRTDQELDFQLAAGGPLGWSVNFRPSFQSEQIGAITLRPNANQDMDVRVTPPGNAPPGLYEVVMQAAAEGFEPARTTVQAELSGSPTLTLSTIDQSNEVDATAGEATEVKVLLVNSGTGPASNVELTTISPPGWNVAFDSNPVASIGPNEALELSMTVEPPSDAEGGDYNIDVAGTVPESTANFRFRVTIERTSAFGFLGIAVIVLVVLGLGALMVRLGRR